MHEVLINHLRLRLEHTTGTEGPKYDPYHYDEYDVSVPGAEITLHEGLGIWLKVNGKKVEMPKGMTYQEGEKYLRTEAFTKAVGYSLDQLQRIARRLNSCCRKCGGTSFHEVSGYPGEYFDICDNCGEVVSSRFYESEII